MPSKKNKKQRISNKVDSLNSNNGSKNNKNDSNSTLSQEKNLKSENSVQTPNRSISTPSRSSSLKKSKLSKNVPVLSDSNQNQNEIESEDSDIAGDIDIEDPQLLEFWTPTSNSTNTKEKLNQESLENDDQDIKINLKDLLEAEGEAEGEVEVEKSEAEKDPGDIIDSELSEGEKEKEKEASEVEMIMSNNNNDNENIPGDQILSNINGSDIQLVYDENGSILKCLEISLKPSSKLTFHGEISVKIKSGRLSVFACEIEPRDTLNETLNIFSPSWAPHSLLTLSNQNDKLQTNFIIFPPRLNNNNIDNNENNNNRSINQKDKDFILNSIKNNNEKNFDWVKLIIPSFNIVFKGKMNLTNKRFDYETIQIPQQWNTFFNHFIQSPLTNNNNSNPVSPLSYLFSGNRNNGKSTFARMWLNSLIGSRRFKGICYLDLDLGQTEFTPPSIISLTFIDKFIIGPPNTHITKPVCAYYFGETTSSHDPSRYLNHIASLMDYYKNNYGPLVSPEVIPLVINTPGWVKGLGLSLLCQIINIVKPAFIFEMTEDDSYVNSKPIPPPKALKPPNSRESQSPTLSSASIFVNSELSPPYHSIIFPIKKYTPTPHSPKSSATADRLRNLALMSYFTQLEPMQNISFQLFASHLVKMRCYSIKFSSICLSLSQNSKFDDNLSYAHALNGQIVGLAHSNFKAMDLINNNNNNPNNNNNLSVKNHISIIDCSIGFNYPCLGLALIRGLDLSLNNCDEYCFLVITPLTPNELNSLGVDTFLKMENSNSANVPLTFIQLANNEETPYIDSNGITVDIGGGEMKSRNNLSRKRLAK